MTPTPRRALLACLVLATFAPAARTAPAPAAAPGPAATRQAPAAQRTVEWPSFMMPNEVLCLDELDFNAYLRSGRFNSRGSVESCTKLTQLTRVVVKQGAAGQKAQVLVITGPLAWSVGWTNARLPLASS